MLINKALPQQEDDISEVLEITAYEVSVFTPSPRLRVAAAVRNHICVLSSQLMERDLKQPRIKNVVPLEFEMATRFLQGGGGVLGEHFCLTSTQ